MNNLEIYPQLTVYENKQFGFLKYFVEYRQVITNQLEKLSADKNSILLETQLIEQLHTKYLITIQEVNNTIREMNSYIDNSIVSPSSEDKYAYAFITPSDKLWKRFPEYKEWKKHQKQFVHMTQIKNEFENFACEAYGSIKNMLLKYQNMSNLLFINPTVINNNSGISMYVPLLNRKSVRLYIHVGYIIKSILFCAEIAMSPSIPLVTLYDEKNEIVGTLLCNSRTSNLYIRNTCDVTVYVTLMLFLQNYQIYSYYITHCGSVDVTTTEFIINVR